MCGVNTYHEAGPHFGGVSAVCAARNKSLELLQLSHQTPVCKQNYMITNAINIPHLTGRVPFQLHVYNTNTDIDCTPNTCIYMSCTCSQTPSSPLSSAGAGYHWCIASLCTGWCKSITYMYMYIYLYKRAPP